MTKPMVRIHNMATDEVIDREMTDDEFAKYQIDQAEYQAQKAEAQAKAQAKAALLERLGLTQEEFNTLTA
jgi:L-arabinose isomerase